jgi:signal transduction histidine kinase
MAERAAALGGRLDVGPRDEGGWRVHARLPLGGAGGR